MPNVNNNCNHQINPGNGMMMGQQQPRGGMMMGQGVGGMQQGNMGGQQFRGQQQQQPGAFGF
tara:strand:+ start:42 stop:227 length:186 start_codon:yes stop_codon:yes gene_type:complete